jgi:serine/threonine protein kinase
MSPARVPNLTAADIQRLLPMVSGVQELTSGGQKQVFKARLAGAIVALKVLLPDRDNDAPPVDAQASTVVVDPAAPTATLGDAGASEESWSDLIPARLRREVDLLAAITAPTVVPLVEIGGERIRQVADRGRRYLVYAEAWIDGQDLNDALDRGRKRMPQAEVVRLALDMLAAIAALWQQEVVHRDIKPHNIIRRQDGRFVLIDLGLALDLQADTITETGAWLGTPVFAAPEINDPELRERVDFRADEFSLGLVLYEALAARHPYNARQGGKTVTDVRKRFRDRPLPLLPGDVTVDPELAAVIMRMIDTDMTLRYARFGQLMTSMRSIATRLGVQP